jgi:outer membrane biogenesis lipoprotein LolB
MTTDAKIRNLKPGREIEISRTVAGRVTVERSGDGWTLRFVRWTADGRTSTVFKTERF